MTLCGPLPMRMWLFAMRPSLASYCISACLSAEGVAAAGRTRHREHALYHGVFVVTAARDRLHRGGIDAAVLHEALVDVHADDLAKDEDARGVLAVLVGEPDRLGNLALQRRGRAQHARRPHQPGRRGLEPGELELAAAPLERRGGGGHLLRPIVRSHAPHELA